MRSRRSAASGPAPSRTRASRCRASRRGTGRPPCAPRRSCARSTRRGWRSATGTSPCRPARRWTRPSPSSTGAEPPPVPRAGLSPAAVVAAAADLADANGLHAVTLAAVAGAVGVRTPSLYNHVGGLDDVRRGVALRALREIGDALRDAAVGRAGDEALTAVAHAYRAYAKPPPPAPPPPPPAGRAPPARAAAPRPPPADDDPELSAAGARAVDV